MTPRVFPPLTPTEQLEHEAGLRAVLVAIEEAGERAGWDSPASAPTLFVVMRRPGGGVAASPHPVLTDAARALISQAGGDVGAAMATLGHVAAEVRAGGASEVPPGVDVPIAGPPPGDGWELYGVAFRSEVWMVVDDGLESTRDLRRERRLDEHPQHREQRMVLLVGRDGIVWRATRTRPETRCEVHWSAVGDSSTVRGGIPHGLSVLVGSLVGNPVPVIASG